MLRDSYFEVLGKTISMIHDSPGHQSFMKKRRAKRLARMNSELYRQGQLHYYRVPKPVKVGRYSATHRSLEKAS